MALARAAALLLVLAAATGAAPAEEKGAERKPAPPKPRLDGRALRLLEAADAKTYFPADAGVKTLQAVLVAEDPLHGRPAARVEFTAPDALVLRAREDVPEALRGFVEERLRPMARLVVGRRFGARPADAHLDYRVEDGQGFAVLETADGPDAGLTRTIRFSPGTGLVASEAVSRDGRSMTTSFRYEKAGDRWRLVSILCQVPGPDGPVVRVDVTLEYLDAEGIAIPWRITQRSREGAVSRCALGSLVVNGKRVLTPDEQAAAAPPK